MIKRNRELWYAIAAILLTTAVYAAACLQAGTFPKASGLVGHGIGILGFIFMLMAETLYSIRKQMTDARWGDMASWLRFHVFSGLVGPYMVLLHTAARFQGLAGIAMLLTLVVVASGVVGRYLYTAVPRELDEAEPGESVQEAERRAERLAARRAAFSTWHAVHVPLTWVLFTVALIHAAAGLLYATLQR